MTTSDETPSDEVLLSATEIAARAGVGLSTVSNWRSRERSFPAPVKTADGDRFTESEVAIWLDKRRIRSPRASGEPEGTTYGDRFRGGNLTVPKARGWSAREFGRHLWNAIDALRGHYRLSEAGVVVLALLWLRSEAPGGRSETERKSWSSPEELAGLKLPVGHAETVALVPAHLIRPVDDEAWRLCMEAVASAPMPQPAERPALADLLAEQIGDVVSPAEHTTPSGVARLMDRLVDPPRGARVHDPFCRAGELLITAGGRAASEARSMFVTGATISDDARRVPALLAALTGVEIDLRRTSLPLPGSRTDAGQFDVVLTNPPFNMKAGPEKLHDDTRWRFGVPPVHNLNFAWMQCILSALRPGGRAAVITANNATFSRSRPEQKIRAGMVRAGAVECVVALPDRLFSPYTSISTSLWLLRAPDDHPTSEILFIDATNLGTVHRRNRRALDDHDVARVVDEYRRWMHCSGDDEIGPTVGFAGTCSIGDAAADDVDLNPRARVTAPTPANDRALSVRRVHELHRRLRIDRASTQEQRTRTDAAMEALQTRPTTRWGATVLLGSVADVLAGPGTVATTTDEPGPVGLVTPRNVSHNIVSDELGAAVTEQVAKTMQRYELRSGDIVGVRSGNVGRFGLLRLSPGRRLLLGPGCLRIRAGGDVDPAFLTPLLGAPEPQDWILRRAVGSALSSINAATLRELPLRLPPPEEQRRIGALLHSVGMEAAAHEKAAKTSADLAVALAEALTGPTEEPR